MSRILIARAVLACGALAAAAPSHAAPLPEGREYAQINPYSAHVVIRIDSKASAKSGSESN